MDKVTIHISANEQLLTSAECPLKVASNTVSYIEAVFELGENWTGYDSVRAVWSTYMDTIATVLDSEGKCVVPHEVMTRTQKVFVNLVGSVVEDDELTDRLTTYPILAVVVNADALVEGTETAPITPSQFEQFVAEVNEEVSKIKDIVSTTLNDDYTLTFVFSDGTETTVGPIRGEQGEQGIQGIQGPPGPPGEVTLATLESLMPTDTANGSIASFPDGQSVFPLKSCVVQINPIQDTSGGDPSPSNICPISGRNSVGVVVDNANIWGGEKMKDDIKTAIPQAVIDSVNKTISYASGYANNAIFTSGIKFKTNTQYTIILRFSNTKARTNVKVLYTDGTSAIITTANTGLQTVVFTSASGKTVANIAGNNSDGTSVIYYDECGVFEGVVTADDFVAYNGTTHTTTLPSTVYGGSVDIVKGVNGGNETLGSVADLGSLSWTDAGSGGTYRFYSADLVDNIVKATSNTDVVNLCCSMLNKASYADVYSHASDSIISVGTNGYLYAYVSNCSNTTEFVSAITGATLIYPLATPIPFSVTPTTINTLKGTNNIFADSGDVSVEYVADIQGYIDKQ